jgi:hypothetical protein
MGARVCSRIPVRSRAGADDAIMRGMCASATRSLCKAIHRWNTHIHSAIIPNACMYLYPCAAGYTDEWIADAGLQPKRAHALRPCARACAIGRARIRAGTCERVPPAWTAVGSARQAFYDAVAFNTNIGAWNTASVSSMVAVCAVFSAFRPRLGKAALSREGLHVCMDMYVCICMHIYIL